MIYLANWLLNGMVVIGLLLLGSAPVHAQPGETTWTHNGSVMRMTMESPYKITVWYLEPRPGIMAEGVRPGTPFLYLETNPRDPSQVRGIAHVYALGCAPIPYNVAGVGMPGPNGRPILVLDGPSPLVQRDRTGNCVPVGETLRSANSTLYLEMQLE